MRTQSNSAKFALEVSDSLKDPLPEPQHTLPVQALRYWPAIVTAKRRNAWTDLDLAMAENLALDLATIDELAAAITRDGHILTDNRGRKYANPATTLLDRTTRRAANTARVLQVDAGSTTGKADHQGKKNEAARDIAQKIAAVPDLIARVQ
ncbi:MAG: P27 family phage terminase small subunit [Candidatus Accumulibacter sp.]|jgi:hypothetical protein|uniref:hypothetical protein n=1 Tax=Accumulibacter sp. TaxID=2053492 RepID=UPI001B13B4CA|nr:hypothetical protein [Accumulibacter sp.]MBO3701582.1 P27 family phage terminase small subunit [Accumulibacter sp.]